MRRALLLARFAIALGSASLVLALASIAMVVDSTRNDDPPHWGWYRCVPAEITLGSITIGSCSRNAGSFWLNGQVIGRWNGPTELQCFAVDTREMATPLFVGNAQALCGGVQ